LHEKSKNSKIWLWVFRVNVLSQICTVRYGTYIPARGTGGGGTRLYRITIV